MNETKTLIPPTEAQMQEYEIEWAKSREDEAERQKQLAKVAKSFCDNRDRYLNRQERIESARSIATEACAYFAAIMALILWVTR